jgi:hypothetical protein
MMKLLTGIKKSTAASAALALLLAVAGVTRTQAQSPDATQSQASQAEQGTKFYCNIKALNPAERAQQKQLTEKLIALRTQIVETPTGYEFQFSPSTVSLAELTAWVSAESKCCPFFDFHIDVERQATLLCLRLTGEEGIKSLIRTEFQVPSK